MLFALTGKGCVPAEREENIIVSHGKMESFRISEITKQKEKSTNRD